MHDTIWITLSIGFGGLLVTIATVFGVRAAFQTNKTTQTITNYEKSLASWKERASAAEADRDSGKLREVAKDAELTAIHSKYAVLEGVVSGATAIAKMEERFELLFGSMSGQLEVMVSLLRTLDPKLTPLDASPPPNRRQPAARPTPDDHDDFGTGTN